MKQKRCNKCKLLIPDVNSTDSFHLQCDEIETKPINGRIAPKESWYYDKVWDIDDE